MTHAYIYIYTHTHIQYTAFLRPNSFVKNTKTGLCLPKSPLKIETARLLTTKVLQNVRKISKIQKESRACLTKSEFIERHYLPRLHSEQLTSNISRIAAACGLITRHYQHAWHAQTNAMYKRPERLGRAGKESRQKNTINYRMILQPMLPVRTSSNNEIVF